MGRSGRRILGLIFLIIFILLIGLQLIQLRERADKIGTLGAKYGKRYLSEYSQWEASRMEENPNYQDLKILIDISEKKLYLLNNREVIKSYLIASGKLGTPSPIGSWTIVNKARWGGGFGTRWMGLNVPWGRYGIHGTNRPSTIGYNASAGCIRMRNSDVEDLYRHVGHGTPVAIVNGLYGPFGYGPRVLKPGDVGSDVMEVQKRLRLLGYYNMEYLDGKYGPMMERAIYNFQKEHDIPLNSSIGWESYRELGIIIMD